MVAERAGRARRSRAASRGRHGRRAAAIVARRPRADVARAARRTPGAITVHDLSTLVEAALIAAGHYDVAKALVLRRAPAADARRARRVAADPPLRRGRGVEHGQDRGRRSARRSCRSAPDSAPAGAARGARRRARARARHRVRADRDGAGHRPGGARARPATCASPSATSSTAPSGRCCGARDASRPPAAIPARRRREIWDGADLRERIAFASIGLDLGLDDDAARARAAALDPRRDRAAPTCARLVVLNAKALIERDAEFSRFAGRILLTYVYEETLGWDIVRDGIGGLRRRPRARAAAAPASTASTIGRIDPRLLEYDLDRLAAALDPTADLDFDFLGLQTLYDRYLHRRQDRRASRAGSRRRRSSGCASRWASASPRGGRPRRARASTLYAHVQEPPLLLVDADAVQRRHAALAAVAPATSTTSTTRSTSIIGRGIAENAMCSKWAGGLGGSWTAVRGTGSHIESHQRREPGRRPVPEAAQRPARRRQPGRQAGRARAAPTSRSGTTTSASSSSCAATPATSAAAPTT